MNNFLQNLLSKPRSLIFFCAIFFNAAVLFFISFQAGILDQGAYPAMPGYLLFMVVLFFILTAGSIFFFSERDKAERTFSRLLAVFFPAAALSLIALQNKLKIGYAFGVFDAIYVGMLGFFVAYKIVPVNVSPRGFFRSIKNVFFSKKSLLAFLVIVFVMSLYGYFGIRDIGKFAAVDEPLWTFDRIPNFWRDIGEHDWRNTRVSDKPGVTVAAISGIGLLFENNPKMYKGINSNKEILKLDVDIEWFNSVFRIPLFIFTLLSIPLFYFLSKKLVGSGAALIFSILLGTSPILLGNSRIINPDGLLWVFLPLSLISYLTFIEKRSNPYLYAAGIFLGLALLTKYVANILFPFFIVLIFVNFIFKKDNCAFHEYFKESFKEYLALAIISITTFFLLYPAVWEKPDRILLATISSQAFAPIAPIFLSVVIFALFDIFILKSAIFSSIMRFVAPAKKYIASLLFLAFIVSACFVIANTYLGMKYLDFESILASPKSAYLKAGMFGLFVSNFYPLVFGVSPLVIIAAVLFSIKSMFKPNLENAPERTAFYLILFILFYYSGSTVSHVVSIIRYQIVLYPIIFLIAAIGLQGLIDKYLKKDFGRSVAKISILLISASSLFLINPDFNDYASSLLPNKYFINIKDMGSGSYEAAVHLNSLPDAEKLAIWTDKQGVCSFFVGTCYTSLNFELLNKIGLDYLVLSSGRESRTSKMTGLETLNGKTMAEFYAEQKPAHKIELGGRPNNYVKIINLGDLSK